jgi:hypothetical protein
MHAQTRKVQKISCQTRNFKNEARAKLRLRNFSSARLHEFKIYFQARARNIAIQVREPQFFARIEKNFDYAYDQTHLELAH